MVPRVEKCGLLYNVESLNMVETLVEQDIIEYYKIVYYVENIL